MQGPKKLAGKNGHLPQLRGAYRPDRSGIASSRPQATPPLLPLPRRHL
jgi:hypothetical protein